MNDENAYLKLEEYDINFIKLLFEWVVKIHFEDFNLELKKFMNIKNILKELDKKINMEKFINYDNKKFLKLNLEIFLKNKLSNHEIPILLLSLEYNNNIKNDDFQSIEMLYLKYDEKFEIFLLKIWNNIINYLLTFPFIGFNNSKNLKKKNDFLSNLHKNFLIDFRINTLDYEKCLYKFNKNTKLLPNENYNFEYKIENNEIFIKILNINPKKDDIMNIIKNSENNKDNIKNRNRILSGDKFNFIKKNHVKSSKNLDIKNYLNINKKAEISCSISPPFALQSEDLVNNYKKVSIKNIEINSDSSDNNEEYKLVNSNNKEEFEVNFKKSKNINSIKNIDKHLKENSDYITLGNDLDALFSYVKYSKYKLSNISNEYYSSKTEDYQNLKDDNILFKFDNIYNFINFDELFDNFNENCN